MVEVTHDEEALIDAALEGLALAVAHSSDLDEDSLSKTSKVKLEKFLYSALADHDSLDDLTYSWYIAGAKADTPNDAISPSRLQDAYQRVTGQPETPASTDDFVEHRRNYTPSEPVVEFADFFERDYDLEDSWFTPTDVFLLDFYADQAPSEYRDLYLAVQNLRNELNRTIRAVKQAKTDDAASTTLSEFMDSPRVTGPDSYETVADYVSEIHLEMAAIDDLRPVLPQFRAFTDILEDAHLALRQMDVERLSDAQLQFFKHLQQFYFYEAWKLPSLVISTQTARGPRRDDLQLRHAQELEQFSREYEAKITELQQRAATDSLLPTLNDYPETAEQAPEIEAFVSKYLDSNA
jgi:hypothetical protein